MHLTLRISPEIEIAIAYNWTSLVMKLEYS